jgi:phospholipase C
VTRASHFAVYNNAAPVLALAEYPDAFPGQYTVDATRSASPPPVGGTLEVGAGHGDGRYDITVVGPNRFLRNFTGDLSKGAAAAQVEAFYDEHGSGVGFGFALGFGPDPILGLRLSNQGDDTITFTVTTTHYFSDPPRTHRVHPSGDAVHKVHPLIRSGGWYDLTVTVDADPTWSRRYVGHLESGRNSITGA